MQKNIYFADDLLAKKEILFNDYLIYIITRRLFVLYIHRF